MSALLVRDIWLSPSRIALVDCLSMRIGRIATATRTIVGLRPGRRSQRTPLVAASASTTADDPHPTSATPTEFQPRISGPGWPRPAKNTFAEASPPPAASANTVGITIVMATIPVP
jgi:hypothetical protein